MTTDTPQPAIQTEDVGQEVGDSPKNDWRPISTYYFKAQHHAPVIVNIVTWVCSNPHEPKLEMRKSQAIAYPVMRNGYISWRLLTTRLHCDYIDDDWKVTHWMPYSAPEDQSCL